MVKSYNYTKVEYAEDVRRLAYFLSRIHPEQVITVTENDDGYTVIYKSNIK